MLKPNLMSAAMLFVLIAGLVSCSKDLKSSAEAPYKAPPPKLIVAGQEMDFREIESLSERTLDFNDQIDFSNAHAHEIEIKSYCRQDGKDSSFLNRFDGRQPVRFRQLLPHRLLVVDLNEKSLLCNFDITLINGERSKHILAIRSATIVESSEASVRISENGYIRYPNQSSAAAQVLCEDMELPNLSFEQARLLSDFDFESPQLYTDSATTALAQRRRQTCRVAISEAGQLQALSAKFEYIVPAPPLQISIQPTLPANPRKPKSAAIAFIELKNDQAFERFVQIPRASFEGTIYASVRANYRGVLGSHATVYSIEPWGKLSLNIETGGQLLQETAENWLVAIPSHSALRLTLSSPWPRRANCERLRKENSEITIPSMWMAAPKLIQLQELDERKVVIGEVKIENVGGKTLLGKISTPPPAGIKSTSPCIWD